MATTQSDTIKIWQVTEIEWFAAATAEDALKAYAEYAETCYGKDSDEAKQYLEEFGEPVECDMDRMKFTDDDLSVRTFREELNRRIAEGDAFPQFFATSEY